jgi:CheY-like chemotaxis protein
VTDTGIGIAASKLGYVFESFTQADSNTTRLYGGTGLGLSICKKLVVLMGSDILLSSEAGKGSCFSFTLKLPKTNAAQPTMLSENAAEDTAALVDKKILVVEDNGINAKLMMAFLKKNGMVPTVAENGLIGVEKAISTSYDLILMDLQMPVMDGYEATKRIKALKPQLPIIALSAEALQDVKALLDEFGFEDYVSKPFDPKVLLSKLAYFTSAHFQPSVHEHNQSHIVSFFRYIEMANNDHVFLELILTQVVEEFQVLKALLLADNDTIILDQVSLEKCVLKLSPSIKMFTLSDLLLKLELFLSFQTSEAIDQSGLKPLLIETIDTVIEEINTKIIAIKS